jgi:hypothetical protein
MEQTASQNATPGQSECNNLQRGARERDAGLPRRRWASSMPPMKAAILLALTLPLFSCQEATAAAGTTVQVRLDEVSTIQTLGRG